MSHPNLDTLLQQHDQLKSRLAAIGDMRPGSLVPVSANAANRPTTAPSKAIPDRALIIAHPPRWGQDRDSCDSRRAGG